MKTESTSSAGTDSPISMTICQDNRCCQTGTLDSPGSDYEYGQNNKYEGGLIRGCDGFSLTKAPVVKLKINGYDGWRGDYVKIFTSKDGKPYQSAYCDINKWLDDNEEITLSCTLSDEGITVYRIQMKTESTSSAGTDSPISMTICQDSRCCSTGTLDSSGPDHDEGQNNLYEGGLIRECDGFSMTKAPVVKLTINGDDGWRGDYVKIFTAKDGKPYQSAYCDVKEWLDDSETITLSCSLSKAGIAITKIVTHTGTRTDDETDDDLYVEMCRWNGSCCRTKSLDTPKDDFQRGSTEAFTGNILGSCELYDWTMITSVSMQNSGTDGWGGSFDIYLANGKKLQCTTNYMVDNGKCQTYDCKGSAGSVDRYGCSEFFEPKSINNLFQLLSSVLFCSFRVWMLLLCLQVQVHWMLWTLRSSYVREKF